MFSLLMAKRLSLTTRWSNTPYEKGAMEKCQEIINKWGANFPLKDLTAQMVINWRLELLKRGNKPSTVNKKVAAIRALLTDAHECGYLSNIQPMPRDLPVKDTEGRAATDDEIKGICQYMAEKNEQAKDLFLFLLETATRWGEVHRLRRKDIDLEKKRVTFWKTKNGEPRSIPLTKAAIKAVSPYLDILGPETFVWSIKYHTFRRLLNGAKKSMGINDPRLTLHSSRHTCASKLGASGIPDRKLMKFGGWKSYNSVKRYIHLNTEALSDCVEALEG